MHTHRLRISLIVLIAMLLAGCGGLSTPERIASYPKITPIAQFPPQTTIVYRAYIELKVSEVDRVAEKATRLANDSGGFLVSSQTWYVDGHKVASLELAVPTYNFDYLRQALMGLGDLVSESVSGELAQTYPGDPNAQYSYISLQLRPGGFSLPPVSPHTGWDPGRTLQSAWLVFVRIFGFLADIVIWIFVVGGPFALIALAIGWVIRRLRRKP